MERDERLCEGELLALGDEIATTAATIDAATHTLLTSIRRFDEHGGWHAQNAVSCAQWLSWRIGLASGAAREKVRVARALGDLPLTDAALRLGKLSYCKVRAMTRVANPDNEEALVKIAEHSTGAQLEKVCQLYRQVGERKASQEDRRWVSQRQTDDGMVSLSVRLFPEEAAVVMEAMRVSAESDNEADGLVAMSEAVVRGERPDRSPTEVMVQIDAATLAGEVNGCGLPAETSRRLLCDAGIVPALEDYAGNSLNIGRKTRTVPGAIKRALRLRDRTCQFPGCHHTRWLDAHHVQHWCNGGETSAQNLLLLCPSHHRHVHEYGFSIREGQNERFEFVGPHGDVITNAPPRPTVADVPVAYLASQLGHGDIAITANTNFPKWDGLTVNYDIIVEGLV